MKILAHLILYMRISNIKLDLITREKFFELKINLVCDPKLRKNKYFIKSQIMILKQRS